MFSPLQSIMFKRNKVVMFSLEALKEEMAAPSNISCLIWK